MKIIGLTGGSGSGKGMISGLLRALGCTVIDTDALYHSMISSDSPCSRALIARFGKEIATENGGIDRPRLASIVFSDPDSLSSLNEIAHGYVRQECSSIIDREKNKGTELLVIDAPQLFEANMQNLCDATVAVICDKSIRIRRICKRDGISEDKALARIAAQHSDEFFSDNCDYTIINNSDVARLLVRVKSVLDKIKG